MLLIESLRKILGLKISDHGKVTAGNEVAELNPRLLRTKYQFKIEEKLGRNCKLQMDKADSIQTSLECKSVHVSRTRFIQFDINASHTLTRYHQGNDNVHVRTYE